MEHIQTLSTPRGRALLRDVFRELRYEKQVSGFTALLTCWRLCTFEREIFRYSRFRVNVLHALGFFAGSSLWMREVVNRFYFSVIYAFVYLGAAIMLMVIAGYRFTDTVDTRLVVLSVGLESCLLLLLFIVMFFSPADDTDMEQAVDDSANSELREIIEEVGEIAKDYAEMVDKLGPVNDNLSSLLSNQQELITAIHELTNLTALAVSPQPEFVQTISETNQALQDFTRTVRDFVVSAQALHRGEIEHAVRQELAKVLANRTLTNRQSD